MRTNELEEKELEKEERSWNEQPQVEGLAKHTAKTSWESRWDSR